MSNRLAYTTSTPTLPKPALRHHPKSALAMIANASRKPVAEATAEAMIVEAQIQADIVPAMPVKGGKRRTAKMPARLTDGVDYPVTVTTVEERALANLAAAGIGFEVISNS